jgi:murein DD-endopeptidase MepM/ murein hydrolase activator NlpD
MRVRRGRLALGSILFTAVFAAVPALPASADVVHEESVTEALQSLSVASDASSATVEREGFAATAVQSPLPAGTAISSPFGYRVAPCAGCSTYHEGIDLLGGAGNPVEAIADGIVAQVGNPSGGLGVYVVIDHLINGQRVTSVYAHMALGSMKLSVGDVVSRGDVVGKVGSTGQSTGPHLFFQIKLGGTQAVNPTPWLARNVTVGN